MNLLEGIATIGDSPSIDGARHYDTVDAFVTDLAAIGEQTGCAIQPFDARMIVDAAHLRAAVEHANRAIARDEAVADDRAVEILCYAAGRRQINQAMTLGVDPGKTPVVIVIDDGTTGVTTPESAPAPGDEQTATNEIRTRITEQPTLDDTDTAAVKDFFDISDAELAAIDGDLGLLVRERVALLDVEK